MAEKKATVENIETVEPIITEEKQSFQELLTKYGKQIIIGVSALVLLVAGYFAYQNLVKAPKETKAAEAIFPAEDLFDKMANTGFNKDSVNLVLNGGTTTDGKVIKGLLDITKNFGGTAAGNRANYMVGATYLQNKEFDKAVKFLNEFSANGAYQLDIKKNLMLGHAYAEQKKTDDALSAYKKAAAVNAKDDALTSDALLIAASYAEATGKTKDAIELYQQTKDNYPASQAVQSGDVDKYLAKLGVTK
jgi:tetratricopeptide (TPR) repeat protein